MHLTKSDHAQYDANATGEGENMQREKLLLQQQWKSAGHFEGGCSMLGAANLSKAAAQHYSDPPTEASCSILSAMQLRRFARCLSTRAFANFLQSARRKEEKGARLKVDAAKADAEASAPATPDGNDKAAAG